MSGKHQAQARGLYVSAFLSFVLVVLKLTGMEQWSWWRVLLPLWVFLAHNAIYLLVGFLCLFAVRDGEEGPAIIVQNDRWIYQVASLVFVLLSVDNLLRWVERRGHSYWFWLCSGRMAMVALFAIFTLLAQFSYWAETVRHLNDHRTGR